MKWKLLTCLLISSTCHQLTYASPSMGIKLSAVAVTQKSDIQSGFQLMGIYDPDCFHWRKFNIYFDGGLSHFKAEKHAPNRSLSILSIAPVARYSFNAEGTINPYIEISIGAAYLNRLYFNHKQLGMHFAFQDRIGIGATFGSRHQFAIGLHALHYSNAQLAKHNSGVTVPALFDATYRF